MATIAYLEADNQEIYFLFFYNPDSLQVLIISDSVPYLIDKFPWNIDLSRLFDLTQDPPSIKLNAFIRRWPYLEGALIDVSSNKEPGAPPTPLNPHSVGNILVSCSLSNGRRPAIRDDNLVILKPSSKPSPDASPPGGIRHLKLVPKVPKEPRHDRPPSDLVNYISKVPTRLSWRPVLKAMYKQSRYLSFTWLKHYTGHSKRSGRFYLKGNKHLEDMTGLSDTTITKILTWLKENHFLYLRKQGFKGEGNSIWELPFTLAHTFAWRRKPRSSKTYLL